MKKIILLVVSSCLSINLLTGCHSEKSDEKIQVNTVKQEEKNINSETNKSSIELEKTNKNLEDNKRKEEEKKLSVK